MDQIGGGITGGRRARSFRVCSTTWGIERRKKERWEDRSAGSSQQQLLKDKSGFFPSMVFPSMTAYTYILICFFFQ